MKISAINRRKNKSKDNVKSSFYGKCHGTPGEEVAPKHKTDDNVHPPVSSSHGDFQPFGGWDFTLGLLEGTAAVVFEECYLNEGAKEETSTPEDPSNPDNPSSPGQIVDMVTYKNLEPGKKYIMKGTLMDKETGKPVTDNGEEIVIEKEFTPDAAVGSVEITLDFTPGLLNGKAAVVFEECYLSPEDA